MILCATLYYHYGQENIFSNLDEVEAVGDIKNTKTGQCLDTLWHSHPGEQFGLYGCHGQGGSQAFVLTHKLGQIRPLSDLDLCLASDLTLRSCRHTSVIVSASGLAGSGVIVSSAAGSSNVSSVFRHGSTLMMNG